MDELQAWKCKNGHVLGQIQFNGRGISKLLLYRHAVNLSAELPQEVEVMGYLEGTMEAIRCDVEGCGMIRTWGEDTKREKVERNYVAE